MTTIRHPFLFIWVFVLALIASNLGWAAPTASETEAISRLGQRWDEIYYHWPKNVRKQGLSELLADIRSVKQQHPRQPELLIWEAIVLITRAGIDPDWRVLGTLKEARNLLHEAIALDSAALDGAAFLTLGCLYYKVPGWPLSFGDDDKARQYFNKALALNPEGIESNYYYGEFLRKRGEIEKAINYFQKTVNLPSNPSQPFLSTKLKQKAHKKLQKLIRRSHS